MKITNTTQTCMQRSPNGKEEKENKIIPENHNDNH